MNTSGPALTKLVRRHTVREATMVDTTHAGTVKMVDMIGFRFNSRNTVASRFARNFMK
jgi:hypothetical protein